MSIATVIFRRMAKNADQKRDEGLVPPEEIARFENICYGMDETWQILDVYRPKNQENKLLPVIVNVHGGGWVYGDKESYRFYCMDLAKRGFAVINFTYRLAPEQKFPASIEDTNLVFTWLLHNAKSYGLDTNNLFAVGDSAGAHILALYACILTNQNYASTYPFDVPEGLQLKAIGLNCGWFDMEQEMDRFTEALVGDFLPEQGTDEEKKQITVYHHVTEAFPPSYITVGYGDSLKKEIPKIHTLFSNYHIDHQCKIYGDEENQLPHAFHLDIRSADANACNEDECAFFYDRRTVPAD